MALRKALKEFMEMPPSGDVAEWLRSGLQSQQIAVSDQRTFQNPQPPPGPLHALVENCARYSKVNDPPCNSILSLARLLHCTRRHRGVPRAIRRARIDDGLDNMLKDDSRCEPIRAREWICHRLADAAGLPVVEFKPVAMPDGQGPGGLARLEMAVHLSRPGASPASIG
jgi:hypothetical protein